MSPHRMSSIGATVT